MSATKWQMLGVPVGNSTSSTPQTSSIVNNLLNTTDFSKLDHSDGQPMYESCVLQQMEWIDQNELEEKQENEANGIPDVKSVLRAATQRDKFNRYLSAMWPAGGIVALAPRPVSSKVSGLDTTSLSGIHKRTLQLYTSAGKKLGESEWDSNWSIVDGGFGWVSQGSTLVSVLREGTILLFEDNFIIACQHQQAENYATNRDRRKRSLNSQPSSMLATPRVLSCPFAGNVHIACVAPQGVLVISDSMQACYVSKLDSVTPEFSPIHQLAKSARTLPRTVAVLRPEVARVDPAEVTFVISLVDTSELLLYYPFAPQQHRQKRIPIAFDISQCVLIAPHPSLHLMALFDSNKRVSLVSSDLRHRILYLDCEPLISPIVQETFSMPASIAWCGKSLAFGILWHGPPWARSSSMDETQSGLLLVGVRNPTPDVLRNVQYIGKTASVHNPGNKLPNTTMQIEEQQSAVLKYSFDTICTMVHEVDGIRVISATQAYMVRKVPKSIQSIFSLGSVSPSSMLVEGAESLRQQDADADASIQALVDDGQIAHAVSQCLDAALRELSWENSKNILEAAAYGKKFVAVSVSELLKSNTKGQISKDQIEAIACQWQAKATNAFHQACKVVKACRLLENQQDMLLTPFEFNTLGPRVVASVLVKRGQMVAAYYICELFALDKRMIAVHWARKRILFARKSESDDKLLEIIKEKLLGTGVDMNLPHFGHSTQKLPSNTPFAAIAACASAMGRTKLALELCLLEHKLAQQVVQLFAMKNWDRALRLVDEAPGVDPNLITFAGLYCLTLYNKKKSSLEQLHSVFVSYPSVRAFLSAHLRARNPDLLSKLLGISAVDAAQHAILICDTACTMPTSRVREKSTLLKRGALEFQKSGRKFASKCALEEASLLELQHEIADSLVGRSLADSILDCFRRNEPDLAERFRQSFKMHPRLFYRIKLRGLVMRKSWDQIDNMSHSKDALKVLSLTDIAEGCIEDNPEVAFHLLQRASHGEDKTSLLLKLGKWTEAAESAYQCGDSVSLFAVRAACTGSVEPELRQLLATVDDMIVRVEHGQGPSSLNNQGGKFRSLTRDSLFGTTPRGIAELRGALQEKASTGCSQQ